MMMRNYYNIKLNIKISTSRIYKAEVKMIDKNNFKEFVTIKWIVLNPIDCLQPNNRQWDSFDLWPPELSLYVRALRASPDITN